MLKATRILIDDSQVPRTNPGQPERAVLRLDAPTAHAPVSFRAREGAIRRADAHRVLQLVCVYGVAVLGAGE